MLGAATAATAATNPMAATIAITAKIVFWLSIL
jgi:hypothetical protein